MKKGEINKPLTSLQQSAMHGALELLQGDHREPSPEWEAQAVRVIYELGAALSAEQASSAEYQGERPTSVPAKNQGEIVMQWSDDGLIWCDGEEHEIVSARCEGYTTRILYRNPPERNAPATRYKLYTTQPAESLAGMAARQLMDKKRWIEIRDANSSEFPDMGPHDYYPVGSMIRIPVDQSAPVAEVGQ